VTKRPDISVLDLAPIREGDTAADAFRNSLDLARHAERRGYRRFWLAEHHNIPGIASAATAVVIGHIAGGTSRIRVGAGGIMLPNHAPLVIAEQFGTLASLYPGRIDLGLGRAPGGDRQTMFALRRGLGSSDDTFPRDVAELRSYFRPASPGQAVRAIPGEGLEAVNRQDHLAGRGGHPPEPLDVRQRQRQQLDVAVQEVADAARADRHAAADQLGVDLRDAPVLGVAEASDESDDVEAELARAAAGRSGPPAPVGGRLHVACPRGFANCGPEVGAGPSRRGS
jgi:alkanesulfonate monooxygenase SsuD/methylene tetrahydromethanopterin reductase-like flavin-dependent oxidoreductase (luciferase family)